MTALRRVFKIPTRPLHTCLRGALSFVCVMLVAIGIAEVGHAQEDGFKSIFNGKDLSGWKGNPKLWSVEDGAITGTTTAEDPLKFNTFLVWQDGLVSNFELELDYRIGDEGNSGIQYRSTVFDEERFIVGGYQADIDASMKFAGINYEEKGRGILAQRGMQTTFSKDGKKTSKKVGDAEELGAKIKKGEWNRYRIVADGPRVSHYINGELMSEVIDHQVGTAEQRLKKYAKVSGTKVSAAKRKEIEAGAAKVGESSQEGVLALQIHVGPVMKIQFKNIKIKTLD
ncbi:MAG: DUF1080 domain-containing protein [Aureliella sp.]